MKSNGIITCLSAGFREALTVPRSSNRVAQISPAFFGILISLLQRQRRSGTPVNCLYKCPAQPVLRSLQLFSLPTGRQHLYRFGACHGVLTLEAWCKDGVSDLAFRSPDLAQRIAAPGLEEDKAGRLLYGSRAHVIGQHETRLFAFSFAQHVGPEVIAAHNILACGQHLFTDSECERHVDEHIVALRE